jgi:uncharacterized protein (TIGR02757 family)
LSQDHLAELLDFYYNKYNTFSFVDDDPISVPHQFRKLQDIEISGLFAAVLAWGLRKTIINKSRELLSLMDNSPHDFVLNHSDADLKALQHFKHRTFNYTDLLYFIHFLKKTYSVHDTLEELFKPDNEVDHIGVGIDHFYEKFVSDTHFPDRTKKHVASPSKKSACKRINMYLRWMVRKDEGGVDFGLWKKIKTHQLICPCDVHVEKIARKLGLVSRRQVDWLMAEELTENLKVFDPIDPVKYDFALFGMGLNNDI